MNVIFFVVPIFKPHILNSFSLIVLLLSFIQNNSIVFDVVVVLQNSISLTFAYIENAS
jgi:hypothetical protein